MKKYLLIAWFLLLLFFPVLSLADEESPESVYRIVDASGKLLTHYAGVPDAGDEYISGDNRHFRIQTVDPENQTATAVSLGTFQLPDVSWLFESTQPVSAQRRAVALYCTHSDESYKPTDGVTSDEERGGIYDVAETFKSALEQQGITVYYSDETHHPHDAGAYRRSRATAASLIEEGVDAVMDIHRDGIPDPESYESEVEGEDTTMVRLLVGRSNQNADANKEFAAQIKAVADEIYPGLIKDIYIGKGSYNQDLMSQSVLLEFGTYTNHKEDVLASTGYMADVMNKTLYGGVKGAAGAESKAAVQENKGGWSGIFWLILAFVIGAAIFAFASTGRAKDAAHHFKRTFQEMTGGLTGKKNNKDPQ
ncbi:MAG: stage II sporulation protein P [Clostridiales bacterium]|nr:stage II sporulation protein P [Clostridiales bacterium]